jgi:protein SCO1/2
MKKLIILSMFLMGMFSQNAMTQHADHTNHQQEALKAGGIHPDHSLYHLDAVFTDHRNETFQLEDFRDEPVIVVMFYGNCTEVCPILIRDTWRLYGALDEALQQKTTVLAISFDTENDTPEVLKDYAEYEQLDLPKWHFVTAQHTNIRMLATMLGVKYQQTSDGHFAHSNLITVLDTNGNITKRVEGLNQPMEEAAQIIEGMVKNL